MKKINSNGYGGRIIAAAGVFLVAVPLCLYALGAALPIPRIFTYASLAIGCAVVLFLAVLLLVELAQDRKMNRHHMRLRNSRQHLGGGRYECQSCGSREVSENDTACRVCGIRFDTQGNGKENRP